MILCTVAAVLIGGIDAVSSHLKALAKVTLVQGNAAFEPVAFMKCLKAYVFYKADAIHYQLIYFGTKLHRFGFLTSYDSPYIGFVQRNNPISYAGLFAEVMTALLATDLLDSFNQLVVTLL
jgi:hypothetical protein